MRLCFVSCFLGNIASVEGVSKMDEIGGGDDGNGDGGDDDGWGWEVSNECSYMGEGEKVR